MKRNYNNLQHFIISISPSLVFLSEPQIFQCDVKPIIEQISQSLCFHLNSEDIYDKSLPLEKSKAKGGTLLLWPKSLDPFITILPTTTPAILPCMVRMPGCITSYHICLYLPTAGKDEYFIATLAALSNLLVDIYEKHDGKFPVFLRGDANVSGKNKSRTDIFNHFLSQHNLNRLFIAHKTYHHFIGDGIFDSDLDVVLFSNTSCSESLTQVICKHDNPLVDSSHDIVVSS